MYEWSTTGQTQLAAKTTIKLKQNQYESISISAITTMAKEEKENVFFNWQKINKRKLEENIVRNLIHSSICTLVVVVTAVCRTLGRPREMEKPLAGDYDVRKVLLFTAGMASMRISLFASLWRSHQKIFHQASSCSKHLKTWCEEIYFSQGEGHGHDNQSNYQTNRRVQPVTTILNWHGDVMVKKRVSYVQSVNSWRVSGLPVHGTYLCFVSPGFLVFTPGFWFLATDPETPG